MEALQNGTVAQPFLNARRVPTGGLHLGDEIGDHDFHATAQVGKQLLVVDFYLVIAHMVNAN